MTVRATISRAMSTTTYRTRALLKAYPELEALTLDGDPVVVKSIDHSVLERMTSRGMVDVSRVEKFRRRRFVRAPSTVLKEIDDDGP